MNRKEIAIVAVLVALLVLWPQIDRWIVRTFYAPRAVEEPAPGGTSDVQPAEPTTGVSGGQAPEAAAESPALRGTESAVPQPAETAEEEGAPETPPQWYVLRNDHAEYTFTSQGAALVSARLFAYRRSVERDSGPVTLDFTEAPALLWRHVPGANGPYTATVAPDGRAITFERVTRGGLQIRRRIELADTYRLRIHEEWRVASTPEAFVLPAPPELTMGVMRNLPNESVARGVVFLGVDTLSPGGEKVRFWGREFPRWFKEETAAARATRPPVSVRRRVPPGARALDWVAVKNKYFVQILRPEDGAEGAWVTAERVRLPAEAVNPAYRPRVEVEAVGASLIFPAVTLGGSSPAVSRTLEYYIGPKKYAELQRLAFHQVDVMEFGMWGWIGKVLLQTLNGLYRLIPNYGVAIILLTILIRIVFWPITRKGTQNMRRMQEIQPQVNAIRAKYKDNPQRQQRELMALYKEHKINPLGGCLPMLIQIPVFIALFVVLRSAIELRFAPFLWIRDLSEPENLLAGRLPFGLSLNLLPLIMTALQVWQQKLTPQAGDPSQQKMMAFMPVLMLVFFYNFASGLVLYWTTNQVLMVLQQLGQQRIARARVQAGDA